MHFMFTSITFTPLLTFSTLNQDHVTEDYADGQYVTKKTHVEEDHVEGQHVTWNFSLEDHADGRHVTESITAEDHGDRHYVTDITAMQQQPRDLGLAEELNQINKQDHGMINIEELLNEWI